MASSVALRYAFLRLNGDKKNNEGYIGLRIHSCKLEYLDYRTLTTRLIMLIHSVSSSIKIGSKTPLYLGTV